MSIPVVVVGAGVVGLTTALELQRANYKVTIVASNLPGDYSTTYTSPYAGANWQSFATKDETDLQDLDRPGYHEFLKLTENPRSGVWRKPNAQFYTQVAVDEVNGDTSKFEDWFDEMANSRVLRKDQLRPGTVYGREFDGVVISVPVYLHFLVQQCLELGIAIKRIPALKHIDQARDMHQSGKRAHLVVNCAGLLATKIEGFSDPKRNFPVRGQVIHVRNTLSQVVCVLGFKGLPNEMLYMFPRKEGGAILGGSFYADSWDGTEDQGTTQRIIQRALQFAPELVNPSFQNNPSFIDIVRVNVGLRPYRDGGVRIEFDPEKKWLIHNYGAGGGGYQGSFGFAAKVLKLANQAKELARL